MKILLKEPWLGDKMVQPLILITFRSALPYRETLHSFFFYKNVVFPGQAEYSYFSADFRLKIFLHYSYIIGYDISVLEFIGVSITSVWYLYLYRVTLCTFCYR